MAENEGGITEEDLAGYEVKLREPLVQDFGDFRLITAGAPTSGPIAMQLLQVIRLLGLQGGPQDARTVHQLIEAFKFAYVDRMKLGDPDKVPNMDETVEKIISQARAMEIVKGIDQVTDAGWGPKSSLGPIPILFVGQDASSRVLLGPLAVCTV